MPRPPGHLPLFGLWLLASLLIVRFTIRSVEAAREPAHGFVAHYAASRLSLARAVPADLYEDERFEQAVRRYEPDVTDIFGANPPTAVLAALPLAGLDYPAARMAWTVFSLLGWLLAVAWLTRTLRLDGLWAPAFLSVAAVFQPATENLAHGQFHVLVLLLVLLAWQGDRGERPRVTGKALGAALALKAAGGVFWLLLIRRSRWRALAWGVATVLALAGLATFLLGAGVWPAFLDRAGDTAASGSLSVTAYQTVPGLLRRLLVRDAIWNPAPLVDLKAVGIVLSWTVVAALVVYSLVASRRIDGTRAFAAFAALALATSPVSLDYHYVLAIFPAAVAFARSRRGTPNATLFLGVAALAAIAIDLPYRSAALANGVLALLAYPKLYGVLVLWWLLLHRTDDEAVAAMRGGTGEGALEARLAA